MPRSFGVVLCARPVIDPLLPGEMVNLPEWVMKYQKKKTVGTSHRYSTRRKIKPDSLRKSAETAEKCLVDYGVDKPSVGDVFLNLEYPLQLQEACSR